MRTTFVALAVFAASLVHAQERTLVWKALDVTAKLENDGTLRVSERHRMLFDGDWNGGQRDFDVRPGQQFSLLGVSAVAGNGDTFPMTEAVGDGIQMREYRLDGRTLRWRARNPDDPPFRDAERTYVIDYLLRNAIARNGESYVLDHDFAFSDRPGPIESFSAALELDSAWQAPEGFVPRHERTNVPAGQGVRLEVQLQWKGEGKPEYVAPIVPPAQSVAAPARPAAHPVPRASMALKLAALAAFVVIAILSTAFFLRREEALGRFEPPPQVTPGWLEENLLVHRAEVVGTAWDGATGPGEVAALIAIMTAEGKIENVAGAPKLRLLVDRDSLSSYERGFVNALFINGNEIDPETLRRHYLEVGFDPARTISRPLRTAAQKLVGSALSGSWAVGCAAVVVAVFAFPFMALAFLVSLVMATTYRNGLLGRGMAGAIPVPLLIAAVAHAYVNVSLGWLIANLIAGAALLGLALLLASWKESESALRNLRNFLAAREFLRQCIVRRDAEVDPRWIPYMLAFGLAPDDRWSVPRAQRDLVRLEDDGTRSPSTSVHNRRGGGGEVTAPAFQAGGGSFGGAGATGSWSSIQTFASTVAAKPPRVASSSSSSGSSSGSGWSWSSSGSSSSGSGSSSRSSSSSSSGSSRSGGGGGGGW